MAIESDHVIIHYEYHKFWYEMNHFQILAKALQDKGHLVMAV